MWFKSRGFFRLLVVTMIATCLAIVLWRYEQREYAGELRTFFRQLDLDADGVLSLQEWMAFYGPHSHPWEQCSGMLFEPADCNGDRQLSWDEFSAPYLRRDYCGERGAFGRFKKPVFDAQTGLYVLIPVEKMSDRDARRSTQAGNLPPSMQELSPLKPGIPAAP